MATGALRVPARLLAVPRLPLTVWWRHERDMGRTPLWLPVFACAGIAIAASVPLNPPLPVVGGALFATVVMTVALAQTRLAALAAPAAAIAALLYGATLLTVQTDLFGTSTLSRTTTVTFEGRVEHATRTSPGRQSIIVSPADPALPHRVRLSVRGGADIRVGSVVSVTARLFPLSGPVMPGGYDPGRRLYFDRIGATGFSYGPPEVMEPPDAAWDALIHRVRMNVVERVDRAMGPAGAPFAAALLVGERGMMDEADVEALRASGLGHILAISGLHMALVAGSVFAAVRLALALVPRLALTRPIRTYAAVVGLVAATIYLILSGGSVATVRAYVMLVVALVAVIANRPALTMRTVAIAAFVCMTIDPISVLEPGFQMSFAAVVALVGAYEWWAGRRLARRNNRLRRTPPPRAVAFVVGLAATSLIAGLATALPAAFHFHRVAPFGLAANLLAMPIFTFAAMPAGVIGLAVMPLGLEALPLAVMDVALGAVLWVAHTVAAWSGTQGVVGAIHPAAPILGGVGLCWLAFMTAPWRAGGAALIIASLVVAPLAPRYDILVSQDARTVAVRGDDGRLAFNDEPSGFVGSIWRQADGDGEPAENAPRATCDDEGCVFARSAGAVAVPLTALALHEDCALAEVIVTARSAVRCNAAFTVDRHTLRRHGSVALLKDGADWRLRQSRPHGAVRPWQVAPDVPWPD